MDPLSITAGCIAVLGAANRSGEGLKRLLSLKNAPDAIASLSNEVEALRCQVTSVRSALTILHGSQVSRDHGEAAVHCLERKLQALLALEAFIAYRLRPADHDGASSAFSKREWLRSATKIEELKQSIRDARGGLNLAIGAMNLRMSGHHALQIQTFELSSQEMLDLQLLIMKAC